MSLVHRVLHTHANLLSGTLVYPSPCLVPHGQLLHACIHFELSCSGSDELHLQVKRVLEIWHCMAFYPPPPPNLYWTHTLSAAVSALTSFMHWTRSEPAQLGPGKHPNFLQLMHAVGPGVCCNRVCCICWLRPVAEHSGPQLVGTCLDLVIFLSACNADSIVTATTCVAAAAAAGQQSYWPNKARRQQLPQDW